MATSARTRVQTLIVLAATLLTAGLSPRAGSASESQLETTTRFLEYDQGRGLLAYLVSVRNLGSLPVSFVELRAEPGSVEGPIESSDLTKGQTISRRFSFALPPGETLFQPRFHLAYTTFEGQRIEIAPEKRLIAMSVDFVECDVKAGRVALSLAILNVSEEPLIFVELKADNPHLREGTRSLADLKVGMQLEQIVEFDLEPGETFFNPTLYLTYHAFQSESTRRHSNFLTLLQPDLRRIEAALLERRTR